MKIRLLGGPHDGAVVTVPRRAGLIYMPYDRPPGEPTPSLAPSTTGPCLEYTVTRRGRWYGALWLWLRP